MEQNQMNNDEIEIDLREIFSVLLSHLGIIILSGLVLGLVAIVGTKVFITPQYQSVTKMYVLAKQNNDTLTEFKKDGTYNKIYKKWFGEEPKNQN